MKPTDIKLAPAEVADMLNVSLRTLSRWQALRIGPARCKVGRTVLYRESAVESWLTQNETQPLHTF